MQEAIRFLQETSLYCMHTCVLHLTRKKQRVYVFKNISDVSGIEAKRHSFLKSALDGSSILTTSKFSTQPSDEGQVMIFR
jgi:hypothetical protein